MRLSGCRSWLFGVLALFAVVTVAGCDNPLDPLDKSDKIQGLTFVDFSATWERWDSDPQADGLVVNVDYFDEFGNSLSFHDKPHNIVIELWTQRDAGEVGEDGTVTTPFLVKDRLIFSRAIEFSNSDDSIRIPIEAYFQALQDADIRDPATGEPVTGDIIGFMVVRVFPPEEFPRPELLVAQPDVLFFEPEVAEDTPNL